LAKKHDWNNLRNYLHVHDSVLKKYDSYFANHPKYKIDRPTNRYLDMSITIHFQHKSLKLEIDKTVEIRQLGPQDVARTFSYSYNVSDSVGSIFRYCSPHHHRKYHHKHVYDLITRNESKKSPLRIGEDEYPHINEVIEELLKL
jgi:hypothetical protein